MSQQYEDLHGKLKDEKTDFTKVGAEVKSAKLTLQDQKKEQVKLAKTSLLNLKSSTELRIRTIKEEIDKEKDVSKIQKLTEVRDALFELQREIDLKLQEADSSDGIAETIVQKANNVTKDYVDRMQGDGAGNATYRWFGTALSITGAATIWNYITNKVLGKKVPQKDATGNVMKDSSGKDIMIHEKPTWRQNPFKQIGKWLTFAGFGIGAAYTMNAIRDKEAPEAITVSELLPTTKGVNTFEPGKEKTFSVTPSNTPIKVGGQELKQSDGSSITVDGFVVNRTTGGIKINALAKGNKTTIQIGTTTYGLEAK